jgi:hypothetical protein
MPSKWVIVDWRPYDLPEVWGTFASEEEAEQYARTVFGVNMDDELPDGIAVRQLQEVR